MLRSWFMIMWRLKLWQKVVFLPLLVFITWLLITLVIMFVLTWSPENHPIVHSHAIRRLVVNTGDIIRDGREMIRAQHLAKAISFQTVSYEGTEFEVEAMVGFIQYVKETYPLVHSQKWIDLQVMPNFSMLYTVTGINTTKMPYMLASHIDVVPVEHPEKWEQSPFGDQIINNFIYGRGALDDKIGVIGILEALEYIISKKQRPMRSFFIAFGSDEERGGREGAQRIKLELEKRGQRRLDFIVDEGHGILRNVIPGTERDVAMIGISEKGGLMLKLKVEATPGHSSMPPSTSSIGILSEAMARIEQNKHPSKLGHGPERHMFEYLAPHVIFPLNIMFSNLWLFSPILTKIMERSPLSNAFIRTTTALTIINGGYKANVVPPSAEGTVNHRIHGAQTSEEIIEFDKSVVNNPKVVFNVISVREPQPESKFGKTVIPYRVVQKSIEEAYPGTLVVPGGMVANTDMYWYQDFSEHIYRFVPTILDANLHDPERYHGDNERVSVENFSRAVTFYYRIMRNADIVVKEVPDNRVPL